jgi:hypothetical protein
MGRTANLFRTSRRTRGRGSAGGIATTLSSYSEPAARPSQSKVKGAMREVIADGLKYLSDDGLTVIADYLLAQPPIAHDVRSEK